MGREEISRDVMTLFWRILVCQALLTAGAVLCIEWLANGQLNSQVRSAVYLAGFAAMGAAALMAAVCNNLVNRSIAELSAVYRQSAASAFELTARSDGGGSADDSPTTFDAIARGFEAVNASLVGRLDSIERQRRDLLALLESIPEGVVALDPQQKILFANSSAYRLFGLPPRKVDGQRIWEIVRHPGFLDMVTRALDAPDGYNAEIEMHGPQRVLSFHSRGLSVGPPGSIIVVLHDVSELRRLERVRQEFLANVSHELKTPLASIKAFTETLLEHDLEDRKLQIRFLRRIEEQADRLHALVIDMLTLARLESRDPHFDIRPIDLQAIVSECVDAFANEASAKKLTLTSDLKLPGFAVLADSEGLATIVRNLIDNAIKYTPEGGTITLSTERRFDHVLLHVSDTGVGIPAADQPHIFERFYRVDKARSRELGGTGLGLSIVKHLVQTFGGAVSVRSDVHKGSTFTVSLPIESLPAVPRPTHSRSAAATPAWPPKTSKTKEVSA